jgi:hypothetical protein
VKRYKRGDAPPPAPIKLKPDPDFQSTAVKHEQHEGEPLLQVVFRRCRYPRCGSTTSEASIESSSLRMGFSRCLSFAHSYDRTSKLYKRASQYSKSLGNISQRCTFVFYHLANKRDEDTDSTPPRSIRQIAACVRQTSGTRPQPQNFHLRVTPDELSAARSHGYSAAPKAALQQFISWARACHCAANDDSNIVLVAHNGAAWAHEVLVQAMLDEGITPPGFRLADSVVLYALLLPRQKSNLGVLEESYGRGLVQQEEVLRKALLVQRAVQAVGGREWQELCYGCSSSMRGYREGVGLLGSQLGEEGGGEARPASAGGPAVKLELQQEEEDEEVEEEEEGDCDEECEEEEQDEDDEEECDEDEDDRDSDDSDEDDEDDGLGYGYDDGCDDGCDDGYVSEDLDYLYG